MSSPVDLFQTVHYPSLNLSWENCSHHKEDSRAVTTAEAMTFEFVNIQYMIHYGMKNQEKQTQEQLTPISPAPPSLSLLSCPE
jgi:hypothetical protein